MNYCCHKFVFTQVVAVDDEGLIKPQLLMARTAYK